MDIKVEISAAYCFAAALICLVLPVSWVLAAVTAALIHELFHMATVLLLGGRIYRFSIGFTGAVMDTSPLMVWQQLVCILAGPIGSLLLLSTANSVPKLAVCGFVQGIYNLIPVYPLDGGRILHCIVERYPVSDTAVSICKWVESVTVLGIAVFAIWVSVWKKLGLAPVLLSAIFVSRVICGKIPCKEGNLRVQ